MLYTNKNKPLDINRLSEYNIETENAHVAYFDFEMEGSSCVECSVKMVDAGRLDGFIYAQVEIDPIIRKDKLKNIRRQLYRLYEVKYVLKKGARGGAADMYIREGLTILRKTGEFQKIMGRQLTPYDDWQP